MAIQNKILFLPHQFLAILYMLAALTYMSQASSIFEDPLSQRNFISISQQRKQYHE